MVLKTYNEWSAEGKYVIKGQHACLKKDDKYYFNENQVITLEELKEARQIAIERFRKANNLYENEVDEVKGCATNDEFHSISKHEAYNWLGVVGSAISAKHHDNINQISVDVLKAVKIAKNEEDNTLFDLP